ncbi:MAG: hypothetical protein V2A66_09835 [Pseudomonadota bacterium]
MVDIGRASRVQEKDVRTQLDRSDMVEALRHGNIYEVFAKSKSFKIGDFSDFFANQWKFWKGQIVQDQEIKAQEASYPEPNINQLAVHHRGASMSKEEGEYFSGQMSDFLKGQDGKFKAMKVDAVTSADGKTGATTSQDLDATARGTLSDWQQLLDDSWSQIMDAQMMSDYKSKSEEVQRQTDRIVALVKQGLAAPEFAVIALLKVRATKDGVMMTWLGKKMSHVNDSINNIARDLNKLSPGDPRYAANLTVAQSKTRDGAFQLNLLTTDMQKVMQDAASLIEFGKSTIEEQNRGRGQIVANMRMQ